MVVKSSKLFFIATFEIDPKSYINVVDRYSSDPYECVNGLAIRCTVDVSAPMARKIIKNQTVMYKPTVSELKEVLELNEKGFLAFKRLLLSSGLLSGLRLYLFEKIKKNLST